MVLKQYYINTDFYIVTIETDDTNVSPYSDVVDEMNATYFIDNDDKENWNFKIHTIQHIDGGIYIDDPIITKKVYDKIKSSIMTYQSPYFTVIYYKIRAYMTYECAFFVSFLECENWWAHFSNGFSGVINSYYEDGQLESEQYIHTDGYKMTYEGIRRKWYENGVIKKETTYVNGLKNGIEKKWSKTGKLSEYTTYNEGKKIAST